MKPTRNGHLQEGALLAHRLEEPVGQLLLVCSRQHRPVAMYADSSGAGREQALLTLFAADSRYFDLDTNSN